MDCRSLKGYDEVSMKRKKQSWIVGDIFLVPLSDGSFTVGQVLAIEKEALNSVICVFTTDRHSCVSSGIHLNERKIISAQFTTPDLLDSGEWRVVGHQNAVLIEKYFDMGKLKSVGFVGVKVIGSGIVMKFLDACFGFYPWDGFFERDFLDKLLLSPSLKPVNVVYKDI